MQSMLGTEIPLARFQSSHLKYTTTNRVYFLPAVWVSVFSTVGDRPSIKASWGLTTFSISCTRARWACVDRGEYGSITHTRTLHDTKIRLFPSSTNLLKFKASLLVKLWFIQWAITSLFYHLFSHTAHNEGHVTHLAQRKDSLVCHQTICKEIKKLQNQNSKTPWSLWKLSLKPA